MLWELVRRAESRWHGLILAGGFVRYPAPPLLGIAEHLCPRVPHRLLHRLLPAYLLYSRLRHSRIPGGLEAAREFIERRTEADQRAVTRRLRLIAEADPRPVASSTRLALHHLYGAIDPIVPWGPVARWLRLHAPTLRASHRIWYSDHTVLASAARESVAQVRQWMA